MRSPVSFIIAMIFTTLILGEAALCAESRYPAEWWKPIPESEAKSWEILPQAAKKGEVILSKRNELGILSNFAATPFVYHGKKYASVEGFWQMMKYPEGPSDARVQNGITWPYTRDQVSQLTAFDAKKAGDLAEANMKKLKIKWVTFEGHKIDYREPKKGEFYNLIHEVMWEKLQQNPEVKRILLKTGDLILKPDHHEEPNAPPAWHYFDIYMEFREKLKNP